MIWRECGLNRNFIHTFLVGIYGAVTLEISLKLPARYLLVHYAVGTQENWKHVHTKNCTLMCIAAVFLVANKRQPPSADE